MRNVDIKDLAWNVVSELKSNPQGFTLEPPTSAFLVGGVVPSLKVLHTSNQDDLRVSVEAWLIRNFDSLPYSLLGGWQDNGVIHLDLVTVLPYLPRNRTAVKLAAVTLGSVRGELAVGEVGKYREYVGTIDL